MAAQTPLWGSPRLSKAAWKAGNLEAASPQCSPQTPVPGLKEDASNVHRPQPWRGSCLCPSCASSHLGPGPLGYQSPPHPTLPSLQPERSWHPPSLGTGARLVLERSSLRGSTSPRWRTSPYHPPPAPAPGTLPSPPPPRAGPCKSQPAGSRPTNPWPCPLAGCAGCSAAGMSANSEHGDGPTQRRGDATPVATAYGPLTLPGSCT